MLPTGKVAFWGRAPLLGGRRENRSQFWLWDPVTGGLSRHDAPAVDLDGNGVPETPAPLFCSGQSLLADGQLFVAGGNLGNPADAGRQHPALARAGPRVHVRPVEPDVARAAAPAPRALVPVAGRARRRADRDPRRLRRGRRGREEPRAGGLHARGAARRPRHAHLPPGGQPRHRRSTRTCSRCATAASSSAAPTAATPACSTRRRSTRWSRAAPGRASAARTTTASAATRSCGRRARPATMRVTLLGGYTYTPPGRRRGRRHRDLRRRARLDAQRRRHPAHERRPLLRQRRPAPRRRAGGDRRRRRPARRRHRRQLHRRRRAAQAGRAAAPRGRRGLDARPAAAQVARLPLDRAAAAGRPRSCRRATTTGTSATQARPQGGESDGRGRDLLAAVPVRRRPARAAAADRGRAGRGARTARRSASASAMRRAPCSSRPRRPRTART